MIVGIEGPVLAGKSSLLTLVAPAPSGTGVDCVVCPCFVEVAKRHGRRVPPGRTRSIAAQLDAARFFLDLDMLRRPPERPHQVVFLDRTVWTLRAHAYALAATGAFGGSPFVEDTDTRARLDAGRPDTLVYLDVPHPTQLERAGTRHHLPAPFLDAGFNRAFRDYFKQTQQAHQAVWLDATQPLSRNAKNVVGHVTRSLTTDR